MKIFSKLYKKVVIFFFFNLYGKINTNQSKIKDRILIKKKKYKKKVYKFIEIKNGRVFTNTSDVAYISNNTLIDGPSMQFRDNYNRHIKSNITLRIGTPKKYKKIHSRVFSLLCGVDANHNYYHWFFDSLTKYFIFKNHYNFQEDDFFLVPNYQYDYQIMSLKMLNIKNTLNAYNLKHLKAKKIISLNYIPISINHPKWIIDEMRKKFLPKIKKPSKQKLKIFINRRGISSAARDISNKKELISYLKKNNFLIIDPSTLSFSEEIKLFNSAKLVLGIYGAAMVNVIFCQNKTHIIELKNDKTDNLYKNIIKNSKLKYHSLISTKINSNKSHRAFDGSIVVNLTKLSKILTKIN
jgi:hypothetical protein